MRKKTWITLSAALLTAMQTQAKPIDFSATVGLELRGFLQNPRFDRQGNGIQPSLFFEPEVKWRSDNRKHRFSFIGFTRKDEQDSERTHSDIRELYWSYQSSNWTTTLGINKVFWGVTESVHLVDVINQTDLVEDLDQEDKLGQPMIHISNQQDWGRVELFVLPYFRERTFPGLDGRFSFGVDIDEDNPIYESGADEKHVDVALRYSHYIGDVDIGLHAFEGTNREARFVPSEDLSQLRPVYDQMTQFGADVQYTRDAWLWKLEAIHRDTRVDDFWAAVGGFEYTIFQVFESDADLGLLLEYQYDDRNVLSSPTIADNDVFLAARYALNDAQDTSILGGVVIDTDNDTKFINIEAERRFGENLFAELRIRAFTDVDITDFAEAFSQDDYVQLSLSWYF